MKNIKNMILLDSSNSSTYTSIVYQLYYYQHVNLTFTGALEPLGSSGPMNATLTFERIGNTVIITVPTIYQIQQSSGTINSTAIPTIFRPISNKLIRCIIINGSAPGGTSSNAVSDGIMIINSTGIINFGVSCNNDGSLNGFGSSATSGSGNGIFQGIYTYSI